MGHQHLGRLPASQKFRQVVALIAGGSDVQDIAAATSIAAETQMIDASRDPAVKHSVWLLAQIPLAARREEFAGALRKLGLAVSLEPTLIEIVSAMSQAIDKSVEETGGRSDLGEMSQLSAAESLNAVAGRELPDLLGATPQNAKSVLSGLATEKQFAVLSRDFFSRLARRLLSYFLSRELARHVGTDSRFRTIREHIDFEAGLDLHCREASRVLKEFSGQWYSKHTYEGGIDEAKAGRFAHVAFKKLREELHQRSEPGA